MIANLIRIVAVQNQQRHDPQDAESLQQIVVVVVVRVLLGVRPGMPSRSECEDEDYQAPAAGFFREVVG